MSNRSRTRCSKAVFFCQSLLLKVKGIFIVLTGLPNGETLNCSQDQLPTLGTPHTKMLISPGGVGMLVEKITRGGFEVGNVSVVPANGLVVEPRSIKPVTRRTTVSTGPFFMRVGDVERTVITVVDLIGVLSVVLVVLVFASRKTWKSGVNCIQIDVSGRTWGQINHNGCAVMSEWEGQQGRGLHLFRGQSDPQGAQVMEGQVVVNSSDEVRAAEGSDGADVGARTLGERSSGGWMMSARIR